jgi:hypothetical protein
MRRQQGIAIETQHLRMTVVGDAISIVTNSIHPNHIGLIFYRPGFQ